jgi:hypothetical protein
LVYCGRCWVVGRVWRASAELKWSSRARFQERRSNVIRASFHHDAWGTKMNKRIEGYLGNLGASQNNDELQGLVTKGCEQASKRASKHASKQYIHSGGWVADGFIVKIV